MQEGVRTAMTKKSLLEESVRQECINRVHQLTPETQPAWGKMDAAQMLAHCAEAQEVLNGKPLKGTPFLVKLFKGAIRKAVFNDVPYPKNARTHPQYLIAEKRTFDAEKERLIAALQRTGNLTEAERRAIKHPLFGAMTDAELGWGGYKHLDYHLSQFGV